MIGPYRAVYIGGSFLDIDHIAPVEVTVLHTYPDAGHATIAYTPTGPDDINDEGIWTVSIKHLTGDAHTSVVQFADRLPTAADRQRTAAFLGLMKLTRDLATEFDGVDEVNPYAERMDTFDRMFKTAGGAQ